MGNCFGKLKGRAPAARSEPAAPMHPPGGGQLSPSTVPAAYSVYRSPISPPQPRGAPAPARRCLDGSGVGAAQPPPPAAAGGVTITAAAEFEAVPRDAAQTVLCLAHLAAPAARDDGSDARPPVTVSAVIDRSGSMSGEKLQLVQRTLHFVIRELRPGDRLGVVAYDDEVLEALPLTSMTPAGKERARAAVDRIEPGGCTNLSGGLFAGLDQVAGRALRHAEYGGRGSSWGASLASSVSVHGRRTHARAATAPPPAPAEAPVEGVPVESVKEPAPAPVAGGVSSVWLFTDGLANEGVTDAGGIVEGMARRRGADAASVFTFGFGEQHADAVLRAVAEHGHGMYYFIEHPASIPRAFAECLGGLLSVVAQRISVSVRAAGGVRVLRVVGQDRASVAADARAAEVAIGDMYAEEQRDIVFEVSVEPAAGDLLAEARLTYDEAPGGGRRTAAAEVRAARPARAPPGRARPLPALDRQRNRLTITEALREARGRACAGRYRDGVGVLRRAGERVRASATADEDYCRELLDDLRECEETSCTERSWHARGQKLNCNIEHGHRKQRSCGIASKGGRMKHMYSNTVQHEMMTHWDAEINDGGDS